MPPNELTEPEAPRTAPPEVVALAAVYRATPPDERQRLHADRIAALSDAGPPPSRGTPRTVAEIDAAAAQLRAIEDFVPLDLTGPLPITVTTLRYVPDEERPLYRRQRDGSFVLVALFQDDRASIDAHAERIGKAISLVPRGMTPDEFAHRQAHQSRMGELVLREVDALSLAAHLDAREAARQRAEADMRAKLARDFGA